jgi:nucleotide-binding universal stress UspA family protein
MRKVIVGYDSREEASDALSLGQALADADAAELHVAVVLPRSHVPFEEAIAGGALSEQLDERLFGRAERTLGSGEFALLADPVGMMRTATTERLHTGQGTEFTWTLETDFSRGSLIVRD